MRTTLWPHFLALLLLVPLAACDSDGVTVNTDNVIGTYDFTQFRFNPDADPSVLAPANVLDSLDAADTSLRFSANGQFLFEYRFLGAPEGSVFMSGAYEGTGDGVLLSFDGNFDDERAQILLPEDLLLSVLDDGARLEGSIEREGVLLSEFSDRYAGIGRADGVLRLSLRKR